MIELEAKAFVGAAAQLRQLHNIIDRIDDRSSRVGALDVTDTVVPILESLIREFTKVNARFPLASVHRLQNQLAAPNQSVTYQQLQQSLGEIELRFADHLDLIKLFVLNEQESTLFAPVETLMAFDGTPAVGFRNAYPNVAFEIEEAAKCIALGRHTASVFHCMRTLEYGIKALAKFLGIPDPVKAAERNWGEMLKQIGGAIDAKWPKSKRVPHSDGAKIEGLYSHLDAIRNPWRNAVMHVESVYAPHEAIHIIRCTGYFMLEVAKHCDEEGSPV